jgi:hypothetical protein
VNNGSQNAPMDMPPMDMQPAMGNDMGGDFMPQGDMGMQQPPMDDGMGGDVPNQFNTNFDAGVEANEEEDPKKFIQQLTGKLSQSLQKYNDNNGQPDVELNKYVAGMITKQAMKGLSENDAEEIIDKVKADEDFSMGDEQQPPMDDGMGNEQQPPMDNGMDGQQPPMNESFSSFKKRKQIKEIVNGVLNKKDDDVPLQQTHNDGGYRTSVYLSPNFEKN